MNSSNWHSTPNFECAALFRIEHLSHAWRRFRSVVLRPRKDSLAVGCVTPASTRLRARALPSATLPLHNTRKAPPRMRM